MQHNEPTFQNRVSALTGHWRDPKGKPFTPLDMQVRVANALATSGRVIVVQPTGGGKTLAAALPFAVDSLKAKQMLFLTPLRALASQQAHTLGYRPAGVAPPPEPLLLDPEKVGAALQLGRDWRVSVQTGTEPTDPLFEGDAVVCTFDQALSSALAIAYSTSQRRRTVNAGAFLTSYIVADELHLFPRDHALTTLLWLLKARPDLPFCLMTATLTEATAAALAHLLDATLVGAKSDDTSLSAADAEALGVTERTRTVSYTPLPMTEKDILTAWQAVQERGDGRVLVVVNTVERAISLARALHNTNGLQLGSTLRTLHSRFYPEDRRRIEAALGAQFGKGATAGPSVVIATQVVEVGLDISATHLLTELAPANALVQRWGRCARWGGDGQVTVFAPHPDGEPARAVPYAKEDGMPDILERTAAWLIAHSGAVLDTAAERDLLDAAHRESDERWAQDLANSLNARSSDVGKTIAEGDYSATGKLIRPQDSRTLLIHGDPNNTESTEAHKAVAERPFTCPGFRVSPGMLRYLMQDKSDTVEDDDGEVIDFGVPPPALWRVKVATLAEGREDSERDADGRVAWQNADPKNLNMPLFVLNPKLAMYDSRLGLSFEITDAEGVASDHWAQSLPAPKQAKRDGGGGVGHETLVEHVERMLTVLRRDPALWPRVEPVAAAVEGWCGWSSGMLWRVLEAAVLLHDAGKLTPVWQKMIETCQKAARNPVEPWLVHTGPRDIPRGKWNRDKLPHALSGAVYSLAVGDVLDVEAGNTRRARPSHVLFTAIATHHGLNMKSEWVIKSSDDRFTPKSGAVVGSLLAARSFPETLTQATVGKSYGQYCVRFTAMRTPDTAAEQLVTLLVTRLLRLADGWSQEWSRLPPE